VVYQAFEDWYKEAASTPIWALVGREVTAAEKSQLSDYYSWATLPELGLFGQIWQTVVDQTPYAEAGAVVQKFVKQMHETGKLVPPHMPKSDPGSAIAGFVGGPVTKGTVKFAEEFGAGFKAIAGYIPYIVVIVAGVVVYVMVTKGERR